MKNNKNNNCNFPTLRFPEFSGEWKKDIIGNVISVKSEKYNPHSNRTEFICVELESISQGTGELLETFNSAEQKSIKNKFSPGTVLFGKLRPYLRKFYLPYFEGVCSSEIWVMRSNKIEPAFLYSFIQTPYFISLANQSSGSKMPRADWGLIETSKIAYPPNSAERVKIGKFLKLIDERIATQNKIIAHLESLIKGLTNQLLIPNSNWQPTTIGQVLTINPGKDYKHLKEGNIPVYGTGGYMLSVNDYLYDGESVCIGRKGTINKPIFLTGKFWTIDTLFYTSNFNSLLPRFGYYLFKTIDWLKYNEASGVPSLSKVSIEKIHISLPSLAIQNSICRLLDSIYDKLALEESVLNNHQTQKAFILQQMFI
ncbi:restriction endonuclease subunit S [Bacteroides fragilis]|nr:restriction endonuclease subunit S [Bacteroides fragilis]